MDSDKGNNCKSVKQLNKTWFKIKLTKHNLKINKVYNTFIKYNTVYEVR